MARGQSIGEVSLAKGYSAANIGALSAMHFPCACSSGASTALEQRALPPVRLGGAASPLRLMRAVHLCSWGIPNLVVGSHERLRWPLFVIIPQEVKFRCSELHRELCGSAAESICIIPAILDQC